MREKLNRNPQDTRGEEIQTLYEDDYKFNRYTNKYGNAYGAQFFTIGITCRLVHSCTLHIHIIIEKVR